MAVLPNVLIDSVPQTRNNFTFDNLLMKELPTLESGLATNADVEVKEGDMV